MPKITKHPRLRALKRTAASGKVTVYYAFDMRPEGKPDIMLGKDWAVALARWDALRNGRTLPPETPPKREPTPPSFYSIDAALAALADVPEDDDDSIESLLLLPDAKPIPVGQFPEGDGCGIYALFNERGGLNYIGKSLDVRSRIIQHMNATGRKERMPFTEYGFVEVPELMLDAVEITHIWALKPPDNRKFEMPCWDRHGEAVKVLREAWGEKK